MKRYLILLLLATQAHAEVTPAPGRVDSRIRVVNYNPEQVYRVPCALGVLTEIQFEVGEDVKEKLVPEASAWDGYQSGHRLYVKPLKPDGSTNMSVITSNNTRSYTLYLDVVPDKKSALYSIRFRYPDVEEQKQLEKEKIEQAEAEKEEIDKRFETALARVYNDNYWVTEQCGEICPTAAHDDGNFVWLEFGKNGDIPAIYEVDKEGKESIVNSHHEGNAVIIERMARKYTLRRGNLAAWVVNQSFAKGRDNETGTVSTQVEAVVKEPK